MSNTVYTKENPPVVSRNGVSVPLTLTKFGKTSDRKGQEFWTLEMDAANQEQTRPFVGDSTLNTIASRFLRRVAMDIWIEETDKATGITDMDGVISAWTDFESGAATMGDLQDQIGDLVDESQLIVVDPAFDTNEDGTPKSPPEYLILSEKLKALTRKISPLKKQYKELEAKHLAAAAKRAAAKAAKEASSPSRTTPAPSAAA